MAIVHTHTRQNISFWGGNYYLHSISFAVSFEQHLICVFLFSSNIKTMTANWWRIFLILIHKKLSHLCITEVIQIKRPFVYSLSTIISFVLAWEFITQALRIQFQRRRGNSNSQNSKFTTFADTIHAFWHPFRRGMNISRFLPFHFVFSIELCSLPKKTTNKKAMLLWMATQSIRYSITADAFYEVNFIDSTMWRVSFIC